MSCRNTIPGCRPACPPVSCTGKSAFDIWRENQPEGSDRSLTAYLASMQGTEGPAGPAGPAGADGPQGPAGAAGPQGVGIVDITVSVIPIYEVPPL